MAAALPRDAIDGNAAAEPGTIAKLIMSNKTPDKFTLYVPDEQEPERQMPDRLEIATDEPAAAPQLPGGAYDPYARVSGDTTQMRRLKTQDLRKLSEWIKTRRAVETLAQENQDPDPKGGKD